MKADNNLHPGPWIGLGEASHCFSLTPTFRQCERKHLLASGKAAKQVLHFFFVKKYSRRAQVLFGKGSAQQQTLYTTTSNASQS